MKNVNQTLGIKRVPFSRMLKSEVADYTEKTLSLVRGYDIESVLIDPVYDQLKAKEPEIRILRLSYGIDTERLRASRLKADLMLTISAFKLKVRMLSKSKLELDVHVLDNAINSHLRYLNEVKNDKELAQKVSGFLDQLTTNVEMMEAVSTFSLNDEVDAMSEAFSSLTLSWQKRVKMLSQRPNTPTRILVKSLSEAVDNLFKTIEVASLVSPLAIAEEDPVDLAPMIEELSKLSEMYQRSIAVRNANNKRKADQGKPGEGEGEGEGVEPAEEPAEKPEGESTTPTDGGETGETPTEVQTFAMRTPFGDVRNDQFPNSLDEAYDEDFDDEDVVHS